jgi:hypothetical protein
MPELLSVMRRFDILFFTTVNIQLWSYLGFLDLSMVFVWLISNSNNPRLQSSLTMTLHSVMLWSSSSCL